MVAIQKLKMKIFINKNPVGSNGVPFRDGQHGGGMNETSAHPPTEITLGGTGVQGKEAEGWREAFWDGLHVLRNVSGRPG